MQLWIMDQQDLGIYVLMDLGNESITMIKPGKTLTLSWAEIDAIATYIIIPKTDCLTVIWDQNVRSQRSCSVWLTLNCRQVITASNELFESKINMVENLCYISEKFLTWACYLPYKNKQLPMLSARNIIYIINT